MDVFNNTNPGIVYNCPGPPSACYPQFTLGGSTPITDIVTYHWNNGLGDSAGGTITLMPLSGGQPHGPYHATAMPATNGVLANWVAQVNDRLPAGTYNVVDSNTGTWSQNGASSNRGFTVIHGLASAAPAPVACTFRGGFAFLCFGQVITLSANPVGFGMPLTLTVNPTSGYSFDASTVIVLEPISGVGFGVGLRTLCGGLSGGAAAPPCPFTAPKTMTIAIPAAGSIPPGQYILRAENWNASIVIGGAGICTPTCTEADAGVVTFTSTPAGTLQITNVSYPGPNGQIAVDFVDPIANVDKIQVRPWLGFQWGNPNSWNPGAAGMTAGELYIKVGCTPGTSYWLDITLFDASGQSSEKQFAYKCV
jgi:hypothetical protein